MAAATAASEKLDRGGNFYNDQLSFVCREVNATNNGLYEICRRYSNLIDEEWTSLSEAQRVSKLKAAWPQIPKHIRPDMNEDQNVWDRLVPHLSQDALAPDPTILKDFLKARAFSDWTRFLHVDLNSTRSGWLNPKFDPANNFHEAWEFKEQVAAKGNKTVTATQKTTARIKYRVVFHNYDQRKEGTGDILHLFSRPTTSTKPFNPNTFTIEEAVIITKVQKLIYNFLASLTKVILHPKGLKIADIQEFCRDVDEAQSRKPVDVGDEGAGSEDEGDDNQTDAAENPNDIDNRIDNKILNMAKIRLNAPYTEPWTLDLPKLRVFILTEISEAGNVLFDLRTDPGAFERCIRAHKKPLKSQLQEERTEGQFSKKRRQTWLEALGNGITTAIESFEWWEAMDDAFGKLATVYEQYEKLQEESDERDLERQTEEVVPELEAALWNCYRLTLCFSEVLVAKLKDLFLTHQDFAPYFTYRYVGAGEDRQKTIAAETPLLRSQAESDRKLVYKKLLWLFGQSNTHRYGLAAILDDLEREIQGRANAIDFFPKEVREILGVLGVVAECQAQFDNSQPFSSQLISRAMNRDQKQRDLGRLEGEIQRRTKVLKNVELWRELAQYGLPEGTRFDYPDTEIAGATAANHQRRKKSRENLDIFWSEFISAVDRSCGSSHADWDFRGDGLSKSVRSLLTHPHDEEEQEEDQYEDGEGRGDSDSPGDDVGKRSKKAPKRAQTPKKGKKGKNKTPAKGSPSKRKRAPDDDDGDDDDDSWESDDGSPNKKRKGNKPPREKIEVSSKTYETLGFFFHSKTTGPKAGEVKWKKVLAAMSDIGFIVSQGNGGSMFFFNPSKELEQKHRMGHGVIFHGPHPKDAVDGNKAREMGRRLYKNFGWSMKTFKVKEDKQK